MGLPGGVSNVHEGPDRHPSGAAESRHGTATASSIQPAVVRGGRGARLAALAVAAGVFAGIAFGYRFLWPDIGWRSPPWYYTVRAWEALACLAIAVMLTPRFAEPGGVLRFRLSLGFLAMALPNAFHGLAATIQGGYLAHTISGLLGGLFFITVWIPGGERPLVGRRWIPCAILWTLAVAGLGFALPGMAFRQMAPSDPLLSMVTPINHVSGVLFIGAATFFVIRFLRTGDKEHFSFACLSLLYGMASADFFGRAEIWQGQWWLSQVVQVVVVLFLLGYISTHHFNLVSRVRRLVSLQRNTERLLKQTETRLRLIAEHSADLIWTLDRDYKCTYASTPAASLVGFTPQEVIARAPANEIVTGSFRAALQLAPDAQGTPAAVEDTHQSHTVELEIKRADGTSVWTETTFSGLYDEQGRHLGFIGVTRDITERKLALSRQRKLEEKLQQTLRLESVGRLAGGIAHDFNNLLSVILNCANFLVESLGTQDPRTNDVQQIQQAGKRAADLTRQLLAFSRKHVVKAEVIDLEQTLGEIEEFLRRIIGEHIVLYTDIAPNLWRVECDPRQLQQVLVNLVVNARDAMPAGGRLEIKAYNRVLDQTYSDRHVDVPPGQYLCLEVSDTGCGMTEEVAGQVFEPFFTTKPTPDGTGLGLSIAHGIVQRSNGYITLRSEPGRGTTFTIYLPSTDQDLTPASAPYQVVANISPGERILMVEDDPMVARTIQRILVSHGYVVLTAQNGEEAMRIAREETGPVDLLLTDVVMPGMSGWKVAEQVREVRPDIQVLFMSGYTDDTMMDQDLTVAATDFIQKPFEAPELVGKVRAMIARTKPP